MSFFVFLTGFFTGFALASSAMAQQPALAQLYPAAPPAGSSFVRVVNPLQESVKFSLSGMDESKPISAHGNIASSYKIVNPDKPLQIGVNGKVLPDAIAIEPNKFLTLVLGRNGETFKVTVIPDATQGNNALKADLRAYNLTSGCVSTIIANKETKVFTDIPVGGSSRRMVNPISVEFVAQCGKTMSEPLAAPPLQPGSRYSLFVTGNETNLALTGKTDTVD